MCDRCGMTNSRMFFEDNDVFDGTLCSGCLSILTIRDFWWGVHRRQ